MENTTQQKIIIMVVVITAFITTFTGSALNLSVPDIGEQFGVSANFVGWLITGYTLAVAALSVPIGRLADITCRKTVLVTGLIIFVACCIAAVFSMSMVMLLIVRIVQGIGAAMIFSTNTAILISAFPGNMRGRVLGYSIASTYTGLSAGPVVGGFLNHNLGWKSIFILTGVLGLIALVTAVAKLPKESSAGTHESTTDSERNFNRRKSFDPVGNVLFVVSIVMVMYGLSEMGSGAAGEMVTAVATTAVGVLFGILFVKHELHADEPAVNVRLFMENIGYAFSNLSALLNYSATFAISYLISIYLQVVMGYSSQAAGLIMIFQPIIMAILSPVMGRLSDKFSPFKMSSIGMAFCAVGAAIFIFIGQDTSLAVIIAALMITGLGFSLFSSPNTNAVMSCVDKKEYGVASSILATMRSIGHTLSMVIVTIIVTRYMADTPLAEADPETLVNVINTSFIAFTVICGAGVFISLKKNKAAAQL